MIGFAAALLCLQVQDDPFPPPSEAPSTPGLWKVEFLPDRSIYRPYLADPRQSRSGSKFQFPIRGTDAENVTIENVLGTVKALALWSDPEDPDHEAEFFIEGAVFSRFDVGEAWDLDAADYRFGFPFAYRVNDVSVKLHAYHITSHLGDEYISREGAKRESYHLEEMALGLSWQVDPEWRLYSELGLGLYTGPATDSGRAQVGSEWVGEAWNDWLHPYAAVDLQTRRELGWRWNGVVAVGFLARGKSGGDGLRFLLEYYRGHDQQTQFKSQREHYWALGIAAGF